MSLYLIDFENVHDSGITGIGSLTENDEVSIFYSNKSEHMSFETHVNIMKTTARVKYIKLRRSAKNYLDFQLCTHLGFLIGSQTEGPYYIISKDTGYDSIVDYWRDHGITVTRQPSIGFNSLPNKVTGQTVIQAPPAKVDIQQNNQITSLETIPVVTVPKTRQKAAEEIIPDAEEEPVTAMPEPEAEICETETVETVSEIKAEEQPAEEPVAIKPDTLPESYRKKVRAALKGKNIPSGNYSAIYKAVVNSYDKLALNNLLVKSFGSSKGGVVYNMIKDIFTEYHSA